ncbi:hypothetical protein AB0K14_22585 [Actinosynnema sp. NPDC050801]|jgi:hypothetical protein
MDPMLVALATAVVVRGMSLVGLWLRLRAVVALSRQEKHGRA